MDRIDLSRITHVILSGAGISAESGVATFRDAGGLWEGHRPEDVADFRTWQQNYALMHRFYSARRAQLPTVAPNPAHRAIAALGDRVLNLTQNVDDLFERAGAQNIIHLHGDLSGMRCHACDHGWHIGPEAWDPATPCPACGRTDRVKPTVVFFHEAAPLYAWLRIVGLLGAEHTFMVVGTSGAVLDINALAYACTAGRKVLINAEPSEYIDDRLFDVVHYAPAGIAVPQVLGVGWAR
jgi:NAD-dependent deacetylase